MYSAPRDVKDVMYLADETIIPYLVCDAKDTTGNPPLFLESAGSDYFLRVGWRNDLEVSFKSFLAKMFKEYGQSPFDAKYHKRLKNFLRSRINTSENNLTFETPLSLKGHPFGDKKEDLIDLQDKATSHYGGRFPIPWSLFTRNNQYVLGYDLHNFVDSLEDLDEPYQFTIAIPAQHFLVEIDGRSMGEDITIDRFQGNSIYLDREQYNQLFDDSQIGKTRLSYYDIVYSVPDKKIAIPVDYVAGVWTSVSDSGIDGFTAQGQPYEGIFAVRVDEDPSLSDMSKVITEFDVPRITYQGRPILPINYGTGSAVAFIDKTGYMAINRAHRMMGDLYSISAVDVHPKPKESNDYVVHLQIE